MPTRVGKRSKQSWPAYNAKNPEQSWNALVRQLELRDQRPFTIEELANVSVPTTVENGRIITTHTSGETLQVKDGGKWVPR